METKAQSLWPFIHSLPFTGMTFRSWREGPSGVVRDTSAPQRDRGGSHNYKSFLVKALREGGLGLIFRCGLEETVNSFNSPKLFLTGTQKKAGWFQRPPWGARSCGSLVIVSAGVRSLVWRFCSCWVVMVLCLLRKDAMSLKERISYLIWRVEEAWFFLNVWFSLMTYKPFNSITINSY